MKEVFRYNIDSVTFEKIIGKQQQWIIYICYKIIFNNIYMIFLFFNRIINFIFHMISFRKIDNFNNITTPFNISISMQRTIISSMGNYLLRYDPSTIYLYFLKDKTQIPIAINTKILKATFSLDQSQIIFTNLVGISAYSLVNQTIQSIIPEHPSNYITDFEFKHDYTIIYYINQSRIYQMDYSTRKILTISSDQNQCNPIKLTYDQKSNTIITSTLVSGQNNCFICKWNINNHTFSYQQSQNITKCFINDIYILGDKIALTKKKLNTLNMNTIILDFYTLAQITRTSQEKSNNNPAFIVQFHNYYIQYFSLSSLLYIYKDDLTSTPFIFKYAHVKSLQYNPYNQCFYIIAKDQRNNYVNIQTLVPVYNCSQVQGAIATQKTYEDTCACPDGLLFNRQSFACQNTTCQCSYQQTCNTFNLRCQLNCSTVLNTLPILSYDKTQCFCAAPFAWNQEFSDCSRVNCRLIQFSQSKQISDSCICNSGYIWDQDFSSCKYNGIFPSLNNTNSIMNESSNTKSSIALIATSIIFLLFLICTAILYYYKRYRNTDAEQKDERNLEIGPVSTHRQFSGKGNHLTPNIQSGQHLQQDKQKDENIQGVKYSSIITNEQNEQNQQNDKNFQELRSNMQNPLVL